MAAQVDFWRDPGKVMKSVDIMVRPEAIPIFVDEMEQRHMNFTVLLDNVQK